ncbi:MAG TPA: tail fiber domain-containing protein [Candidatus Paceibacterota bacterium]|nr:tail fiber domain-containing protein [Candidatus Paceibacterota bacterium]
MSRKIFKTFVIALAAVLPLSASAQWSGPGATPPSGNAAPPLNTSSTAQSKAGGLLLNTGNATNGLIVQYGNVGVGATSPGAKLHVLGGGAILGTTGSAASSRTLTILDNADGQINFGSYSGQWRSSIQIQSNDAARLLFIAPPESDYGYGILRAANGGLKIDVGGTTGDSGSNAISIESNAKVGIGMTPSVKLDVNGEIQTNDWLYNSTSAKGLYNTSTGKHFYSESASYWALNSTNGLVLRNGYAGTVTGYLYWDGTAGSNNFGLLSPNGSWKVRTDNSTTQLYGNVYMPFFYDTDNSAYYVDPHSVSRFNDIRPNIIYDGNDTNYYLDMNGSSKIGYTLFPGGANMQSTLYITGGALWAQGGVTTYLDGYVWVRGPAYGGQGDVQIDGDLSLGAHVASGGGGTIHLYGDGYYWGSWNNMSDQRLKKNIVPIADPIEKIEKLNGVAFDWKDSGKHSVGVIAQDVEKVFPELVSTDDKTGYKAVQYQNLVAPLIEAVKAQQKEIEALKAEVEALKKDR